ncbi:MAG: DHH family phosphoesterase [Clostridia bacterium]|nr:DHH family phosphoesterase [Clostridia bacterium]
MKKNRNFWFVTPQIAVLLILLFVITILTLCFGGSKQLFIIQLTIALIAAAMVSWRTATMRGDLKQTLENLADKLGGSSAQALESFPSPAAAVSSKGELIYYNDLFKQNVLDGVDAVGARADRVFTGFYLPDSSQSTSVEIRRGKKVFSMSTGRAVGCKSADYILIFNDITELRKTEDEFYATRPVVITVLFDNREEILNFAKESDAVKINGAVQALVEDWVSGTTGVVRKVETGKFIIVVEERHAKEMFEKKFDIIGKAHDIKVDERNYVTLSIGVGRGGKTFKECEKWSVQALDMALGRGGDQAAVKSTSGYNFFGGTSKTVEKRSKVRSRIIATSIADLIRQSDNVLVMGHRLSDIDCVGAAIGICCLARNLGKEAKIVCDTSTSLATPLIDSYIEASGKKIFVKPDIAVNMVDPGTLLIVVDTHVPSLLESQAVYKECEQVIVIDHHRKMVNYIDNAVIFFLEPFASSASEMVSEIIQYVSENSIGRPEAEALLAGIILDTKDFVLHTGVRTFEAASYLRRRGADTMETRHLFSESFSTYMARYSAISQTEFIGRSAVSCITDPTENVRIVAAQAADELLNVKEVDASYVIFPADGFINISARSLGRVNVQLVMEQLGGGGHQAMAGAQLKGVSMDEALAQLRRLIDKDEN